MFPDNPEQTPSRPFKGFDRSPHFNVQRLIVALYGEYEAWYRGEGTGKRIRDPGKIKQHLTHFVLEAYRTHRALPTMAMGVPRGKDYYTNYVGRYHPNHLSYRVVTNVTDFLVECGHFEMPSGKGEWHPDQTRRRTTRYRATRKLMTLCDEHNINPYMIETRECPETIILRAAKKRNQSQGIMIDYTDTTFTRRSRENLERINAFITSDHINLDVTDDQEKELRRRLLNRNDPGKDNHLDFTKTRLRRIFNNGSFDEGGRFYGGWWQQIPSDYRTFITINSKRTVQLDYSGMHFAVMYASLGMDTPMDDPYTLDTYGDHLHGHVKKAFNIIINCGSRAQAVNAVDTRIQSGELSDELGDGETLIHAFIETHPLIQDKIASGEGIRGQFVDSQIAEKVMLKGMEVDLCVLPVHDGFITAAGDEFVLENLMNDAFFEVTGHGVKVKPESFDLSVFRNPWGHDARWVTRRDGRVERDGRISGTATAFTRALSSRSVIWERVVDATTMKGNKLKREREWKDRHGEQSHLT